MEKSSEPVQNRPKIRLVRKSEPEIGRVRKPTVPFPYEQKRQVQFRSTVRNCWVSTGTRKCISLTELVTLSWYIRETLFSCRCFLIFRNKVLNLISVSPKTLSFSSFITDVFSNFSYHKRSPFWRWSMNVVNCLEIFCMHFCVFFGRIKKLQIKFLDYLKEIYPSQLTVEKANKSDHLADYLDLTFIIDSGGKLSTRLYDKRDDFDFHIVNFPFLSSNIPSGPSYGVYISQLIRYARCCSHNDDFRYRHKCLVDRLLSQGYKALRLEKSFKKFC